MRKFIVRIFLIGTISFFMIASYSILATKASLKYNGMSTADQINSSFRNAISDDYNCYFLGNSRIYRDINPDCFPTVKSYNFAHDNDTYNQMYYKLLYLLDNDRKIDYLIIGTDYFQFSFMSDTRNYVYSKIFPSEYSKDYEIDSWLKEKESYIEQVWTNKQNALPSCIYYILGKPAPETMSYLKDNGQYVVYGEANPNDKIYRDYSVLQVQFGYFVKILELCEKEGIQVYVIMPPLWKGETVSHTDLERKCFDRMIEETLAKTCYANNYLNFSEEKGLLSYRDFIDITHLKPSVADEYSRYLNDRIFGSINIE